MSNRVSDLSWDAVAARIAQGAAAILPIGAGAKEHGLHLPMGTDLIQAEWLADRVAAAIDALIWPTIAYGAYPAFAAYPGSATLSTDTFKALLRDLATGLLGHDVRCVLLLNTGLSTIPPIDALLRERNWAGRLHHLQAHAGRRYRDVSRRLAEQRYGSHADELETSIMLAIAPDEVRAERARPSPPGLEGWAGALSPDPAQPGFSASGSFGDPTLATRAKGEELAEAMATDVIEAARAALASAVSGARPV